MMKLDTFVKGMSKYLAHIRNIRTQKIKKNRRRKGEKWKKGRKEGQSVISY